MGSKWFGYLQQIGQSLMLPVSVLPAAGLLVAIGRLTQSENARVAKILVSGGLSIFEYLPLIFAVGVAIGFTENEGAAGLAAAVGYVTMTQVLAQMTQLLNLPFKIDTGVFGGIVIGLVAAAIYRRFYQLQLNPIFGFFSGKRLVPILTVIAALFVGVAFGFLWPPVQNSINTFGAHVASSAWGPAFYAAGKRLLIPIGLHHVYYPPFLFEFGKYTLPNGETVYGDAARYFAGDPTAGRFMASEYPIMLFGLPAAALAITLRAEHSQRKVVAGVMLSAALTSILTGITEPIEFTFIFVAPLLYAVHVLLAFLSGCLTAYYHIHLGYTFSGSAIDYVLGYFNARNSAKLFLIVGPLMAILYFSLFYWLIGIFDFKTPGRGNGLAFALAGTSPAIAPITAAAVKPEIVAADANAKVTRDALTQRAAGTLKAIGGAENILSLTACITRLRLTAKDPKLVDENRLKSLGAAGVLNAGAGNFQIVFGVESDLLRQHIEKLIHSTTLDSPLTGEIIALENVPDPTFAKKIAGEGIAIKPTRGELISPCDGTLVTLFPTHHALGIRTDFGAEILIHIGIDTVKLAGRGFTAFAHQGDRVHRGQKLIDFDLGIISKQAPSTISPIVVTNPDLFNISRTTLEQTNKNAIQAGQPLLEITAKQWKKS